MHLVVLLACVGVVLVRAQTSNGAAGRILPPIPFLNLLPYQGVQNPGACVFNGPQDSPVLRGENFIENFGLNKCLAYRKGNGQDLEVSLETCNWQ